MKLKRICSILSMLLSGKIKKKNLKSYVSKRKKLILYIDMDGTIFNYKYQKEKFSNLSPDTPYPQSIEGFFDTMPPIHDSIKVVRELLGHEKYDVFFLTAPSVENHLSYSEKRTCIEKHFGLSACRKLIISNDKSLSIGDILIDDAKEGRGQELFLGHHIVFKNNWKDIRDTLL